MPNEITPRPVAPSGPRALRARESALAAAGALLAEGGVGAVSIDAVAARSGVARTTIYRHWASRQLLVADLVKSGSAPPAEPNSGNIDDDVRLVLTGLAIGLTRSPWAGYLPSLLHAAAHDPALAAAHHEDLQRRQGPLRAVLARAVEQGDIPASTDVDQLISALVGPLIFRRIVTHERVDAPFAAMIARTVLAGARAGSRPSASPG